MKRKVQFSVIVGVVALLTLLLWGCGTDGVDQDARDTEDIPTNFKAVTGADLGEIELSWSAVTGIDGYMILRTTDMTKPFDTIETYLPDTLYIDTVPADGQRYYYKVISVYADGSTSFASSVADAVGYYLTVAKDTVHKIGIDTIQTIDSVKTVSDTVVTTVRYQITTDTTIEKIDTLAGTVTVNTVYDTLAIKVDSLEIYRYVDTLGVTQDTTTTVNVSHLVGYDTLVSVDTAMIASNDTVVTTKKYEITTDTTLNVTSWFNRGIVFDTTYDTISVAVDTALIFTFADTLGKTFDTTLAVDTQAVTVRDTLVAKDSTVQPTLDTIVATIRSEKQTISTFVTTDTLVNLVSVGKKVDTTITYFTVAIDTTYDTLKNSAPVWPTVVTLTADSGKVLEAINLSWLDAGPGFVYDLYVIRPNITYNNTVYELVASGLTTNSYADSLALPSWQTYKLVVRHPQLTGSREATAMGYRKVTDREFWIEMNNTVFKSQSKLTLMHKSGLSAVGNETAAGDTSGTVVYNATGGLGGATAKLTYGGTGGGYRDFFLTLNGIQFTNITNVFSQNGTVKDSIFVTGIYSGKVEYDLTVGNGKPNGGNYYVTQTGGTRTQISFSSVSAILADNPYSSSY